MRARVGGVQQLLLPRDGVLRRWQVGVPQSWLAPLGVLKGAGAAGLLLGLLGLRSLGTAAAIGLVVFFAGALATHVRARVFHNIAFPGAFFAPATAATALAVAAQ
jgi:hypothetical protein